MERRNLQFLSQSVFHITHTYRFLKENLSDKFLPCETVNSNLSPEIHIYFIRRDSETFFIFFFPELWSYTGV